MPMAPSRVAVSFSTSTLPPSRPGGINLFNATKAMSWVDNPAAWRGLTSSGPVRHGEGVHDRMPIAFLDRDGVINKGKPGYVNGPEEVHLLDGAAKVIGDLNRAGYLVCGHQPIANFTGSMGA